MKECTGHWGCFGVRLEFVCMPLCLMLDQATTITMILEGADQPVDLHSLISACCVLLIVENAY